MTTITLNYTDTLSGIDDAIAYLRSRKIELERHAKMVKNHVYSEEVFEDFIERYCEFHPRFSVVASDLKNAYVSSCLLDNPEAEIPSNFTSVFGRIVTSFINNNPELCISRKYTKSGTSYSGLRLIGTTSPIRTRKRAKAAPMATSPFPTSTLQHTPQPTPQHTPQPQPTPVYIRLNPVAPQPTPQAPAPVASATPADAFVPPSVVASVVPSVSTLHTGAQEIEQPSRMFTSLPNRVPPSITPKLPVAPRNFASADAVVASLNPTNQATTPAQYTLPARYRYQDINKQ